MKGKIRIFLGLLTGLCILGAPSLLAADTVTLLLADGGKRQVIGDIKDETYKEIVIIVEGREMRVPVVDPAGKFEVIDVKHGSTPEETVKLIMLYENRKYAAAFEQAKTAYTKDVVANPWVEPYIRFYAGKAAFDQARYGEIDETKKKEWYTNAEGQYSKLLAKTPMHYFAPQAALGRTLSLMRMDNFDEAKNAFKAVADSDYPDKLKLQAKAWEGRLLVEEKKYDDALQTLESLRPSFEKNPDLSYLVLLSEGYAYQGKTESQKAESVFEEVGISSPDDEMRAEAFNARGASLNARGQTREALLSYLRVVILHSDMQYEYERALYNAILCSVEYYGNDRQAQMLIQTFKARCPGSPWKDPLGTKLAEKGVPF